MSCFRHLAARRPPSPPVVVRLTLTVVSLQCYEFYTYAFDECLRYVTCLTGSGH
jgi:hypothetical protein